MAIMDKKDKIPASFIACVRLFLALLYKENEFYTLALV